MIWGWLAPYRGTFLAVVALGVGLRLPGLIGDLWLDEIWSLKNALAQASWWDLIASLKTDNNHHLTSLWLRALGPLAPSLLYRLPSLLTGIGTIAVAAWVARRDGRTTAIVTALVFAVSYPLIYYASEARGYAPVVFFTLAAWYCLREYLDAGAHRHLVGFWCCCAFGIMSHITFVELAIGSVVWCDTHLQRSRRSLRAATRMTVVAFAVPVCFLLAFYWVALRGVVIAGGPQRAPEAVTAQMLSLLVGGPADGAGMWVAGALTAILAIGSVVAMFRRADDRWLMYLLTGLALPFVLWVLAPNGPLYPRYLLVPGSIVLLAISDLMARWLQQGALTRVTAALTLTAMCSGSVVQVMNLREFGRGRFERAVMRIAEASPGVRTTVSSTGEFSQHDERIDMLVDYYARRRGAATVAYVAQSDYPVAGVDWLITEQIQGFSEPAADVIADFYGHQFLFDGEYRSSTMTGISWRLYRRLTR